MVYLDNAATTPVDPRVAARMADVLLDGDAQANPSSLHAPGRAAAALVEAAREQVAALVGAAPGEIVFTSGATESINIALKGVARALAGRGRRHVVTSRTEHSAGIDTCRALEKAGFDVTWLTPDQDGLVDPALVAEALRDDTAIVSIMY